MRTFAFSKNSLWVIFLLTFFPRELFSRAPRPPSRNGTTCGPVPAICPSHVQAHSASRSRCYSHCPLEAVTILGLFELTENGKSRSGGKSEVEAAKLAVHHVNSRRILGGVSLNLIINDTKGDPGVGLDTLFYAIYTRKERLAILLGSSNSEVTENLARVTPYWNMLQVSFGAKSPALSDRSEFPYFYRTIAPDSSHNPARIAFLKKFNWETVTAFSQNEDVYSLAVNDLVTELEAANITCKATITFAETEIKEQLKILKELDTRIIIGSFSHAIAPMVFCEAHKLGIFGGDYAWLLQGLPAEDWWTDDLCPQEHMRAAVDGIILVNNYKPTSGTFASVSGLSSREFESQMEGFVGGYAYETYDAVWAIALALVATQKSVKIVGNDYKNKEFPMYISRNIAALSFKGVSGPVTFDGSDRIGLSAFYQLQDGTAAMIAIYDPYRGHLDMFCAECVAPVWPGGQAPTAKRFFRLRTETVQPLAFIGIALVAIVGICLAILFLSTNLHFRRHKYIKLSSPKLNNVAGVGCVLVYAAVILLGMDSATLPSAKIFPTICTARVYLLSAGFSMAFGSMFAKTYRVHRIFTRNARGVKNKLLQDTQLISLICVLLVVDGLIVTLWVTIDPIERQLKNLSLEMSPSERSIVYQPQIEVCSSMFIHNWLGALYVYKGLMLTVGVYMAWETRHVKVPALNDSQYIGLSVYSVVITSVLVVVLANLVSERVTLAFLCISLPILISTTGSLCLLFVPKLYEIFVNKDDPEKTDPIMQSMGLKIECNTRRFLTDDRRELYFRVEVQNRVYRRELHLLDGEIQKLEKQLNQEEGSTSSSPSSPLLKAYNEDGLEKLPFPTIPRGKSTSVSSGIPVLLLSVLPPVIPRASWPSEDFASHKLRRGVTFNSEPKLDEKKSLSETFGGKDRASPSGGNALGPSNKVSVFGKILHMIYPGQNARKSSAPAGFVSAFKAHVEYFASTIPGNRSGSVSGESSTNGSKSWVGSKMPFVIADDMRTRKLGSLGGLGMEQGSDGEDERESRSIQTRSVQSLTHPTVSFSLQGLKQRSQPTLSTCRERYAKGSPRFPHKISPTISLEAFEENHLNLKKHTFLKAIRQEPEGKDADAVASMNDNSEEVVHRESNSDNETTQTTEIDNL